MNLFFSIEMVVAFLLQAMLVVFLLRDLSRQYSIVLLYSATYLLTTAVEAIAIRQIGSHAPLYGAIYWTDEIVLDLLLFLMVILLTFQAAEGSVLRGAVGKVLFAVALIAIALPFAVGSRPYFTSRWFVFASQILNFGGVLMNLGLWTALIGSKRREPRLLLVSTGLGVTVTGQAIHYGILLLTKSRMIR
ncbi:MAG TPA: hypothetical protein VLM42_04620, partial [Bryobacteraceae bacterium]|nr:hypothetical protein [Bryobacteraceae bacterium]